MARALLCIEIFPDYPQNSKMLDSQNYLENQFLVAMPQLHDTYFGGSLTYLWKHSEEGALGFVVNKPLRASVADIFNELGIQSSAAQQQAFKDHRVLAGGPVEQEKGFIIHDSSKVWDSSMEVSEGIHISTSKEVLQDIADGKGPERFMLALGCAGWDAGQLESEVTANTWLTVPATIDIIFSEDFQHKAEVAVAQLGIDLSQLSPDAGHS
jgi:putative transcriptional regulator